MKLGPRPPVNALHAKLGGLYCERCAVALWRIADQALYDARREAVGVVEAAIPLTCRVCEASMWPSRTLRGPREPSPFNLSVMVLAAHDPRAAENANAYDFLAGQGPQGSTMRAMVRTAEDAAAIERTIRAHNRRRSQHAEVELPEPQILPRMPNGAAALPGGSVELRAGVPLEIVERSTVPGDPSVTVTPVERTPREAIAQGIEEHVTRPQDFAVRVYGALVQVGREAFRDVGDLRELRATTFTATMTAINRAWRAPPTEEDGEHEP
jgi:hypothetical protein